MNFYGEKSNEEGINWKKLSATRIQQQQIICNNNKSSNIYFISFYLKESL